MIGILDAAMALDFDCAAALRLQLAEDNRSLNLAQVSAIGALTAPFVAPVTQERMPSFSIEDVPV